jgi:cell division septation protein DedD
MEDAMMRVNRFFIILYSMFIVAVAGACSSSEEISAVPPYSDDDEVIFERVDRDDITVPETDVPEGIRPAATPEPPQEGGMEVEVRGERTVIVPPTPAQQPTPEPSIDARAPRAGAMMWSVQLGAFRHESGALQLVEELKQKFNQPVYKRYDAVTGFYKVTLGSYQNRDDAARFKLDVQSRGYPDAFVVEVAR